MWIDGWIRNERVFIIAANNCPFSNLKKKLYRYLNIAASNLTQTEFLVCLKFIFYLSNKYDLGFNINLDTSATRNLVWDGAKHSKGLIFKGTQKKNMIKLFLGDCNDIFMLNWKLFGKL